MENLGPVHSPSPAPAIIDHFANHESSNMNPAPSPAHTSSHSPAPSIETFGNLNVRSVSVDSVLKAIFFGTIFYLLSLPELYKMTKKCCKKVDGVLLHSIVFTVLYFILNQVI